MKHWHLILGVITVCQFGFANGDQPLRVDGMVVTVIESVDVPSSQTGAIAQIGVRAGDAVVAGESIAMLDDREAIAKQSIAKTQFDIARRRVSDDYAAEIAMAKLESEMQAASQHVIVANIAGEKAAGDVRVRAAKKSSEVAKVELDRATRSRDRYIESVSKSEIDALRLAYERSLLEIQQAEADRHLDRLAADAEQQATLGHQKNVDRYKLEAQQASGHKKIAELEIDLASEQLKLAVLETQQHTITSPIAGVVAELHKSKGDWVTTGQPVARVIRLDRLRAEGFVGLDQLNSLRSAADVRVSVRIDPETQVRRPGKVVFISPEVDPVNNEVRFWVEFDNADGVVLPGMKLTMETQP